MSVDRGKALAEHHAGRTYFFCGPGCRAKFVAEPERFVKGAASGR
jgi:Cu+-exporting ATPase